MRAPAHRGRSAAQDCSEQNSGSPSRSSTLTRALRASSPSARVTMPHRSASGRFRASYRAVSGSSTSAAKSSRPLSSFSVTCSVSPLVMWYRIPGQSSLRRLISRARKRTWWDSARPR